MNTIRHNLNLMWRNKMVIAPRRFVINDKIRYIHICGFNCEGVQLFDHLRYVNNTCVQVARSNYLKLHSNTKGLYFIYSYWVSNCKKKSVRIYICE